MLEEEKLNNIGLRDASASKKSRMAFSQGILNLWHSEKESSLFSYNQWIFSFPSFWFYNCVSSFWSQYFTDELNGTNCTEEGGGCEKCVKGTLSKSTQGFNGSNMAPPAIKYQILAAGRVCGFRSPCPGWSHNMIVPSRGSSPLQSTLLNNINHNLALTISKLN